MPPRGDRAAVLVVRDGRLLVIHRRKHGEVYDAIPGGTIEPGEGVDEAAIRELEEETGIRARVIGPVITLANEGRHEYYFDALDAVGEPVLGGAEARRNSPENRYELGWIALDRIAACPLRPPGIKAWLASRDWSAYPGPEKR